MNPFTPSLPGKQDDLCIAIQLSLIGCQKVRLTTTATASTTPHTTQHRTHVTHRATQFFQEGKYRNFRAPDYLTPQGLERNKLA